MAKRVTEILIDDLDGTEITDNNGGTVQFSFQGVNYEIDLSSENTNEFAEVLEEYIGKARKASPTKGSRKGSVTRSSQNDVAAMRVWLREQGHTVSDRGRIPADLVAAYEAAH